MPERAHELPEPEPVAAPVAAPSPAAAPLARSPHGFGCGCGACSRSLSPDAVLALQRGAGNAAVARRLAARPSVARVIDDRAFNAAREARDAWIAGGRRGPRDHAPSTGRGGFEASYDPKAQQLVIELRGGVEFKDGMDMWFGRWVVATQSGNKPAAAAAAAINKLPVDQRRAAMAPWIWDDAARTTFLEEFEHSIEDAWKAKHQFHCTREHWTDLAANVDVRVVVHTGKQGKGDHMNVVSYKESDATVGSTPAHVAPTELAGDHDADDNEMVVTSNHTRRRKDIAQSVGVAFDPGTNTLTAQAVKDLNYFGDAYKSGGGPRCSTCKQEIKEAASAPVNVEVAGEGADAAASAQARFAVVKQQLVSAGLSDADARCRLTVLGPGSTGGRVAMGAGVQQIVAAHEAGHMFGLGDEYTAPFSGTGGDLGTPVDGNLGPSQGLPGAVAENSDTIMSVGDAVRPQHYATFLEALKAVSELSEWALGPPVAVHGPNPALDPVRNDGTGPASPTGTGTAVA